MIREFLVYEEINSMGYTLGYLLSETKEAIRDMDMNQVDIYALHYVGRRRYTEQAYQDFFNEGSGMFKRIAHGVYRQLF